MTLGHVGREYPNHLSHALEGPEDARTPSELHPIFYGSFDWHSCVHGWWQLLRLIRLYPDLPIAAEVRARADAMLVPDKVAAEIAYFERPSAGGFERPYGWAWLLALHDEASRHDAGWAQALEPFALFLAERFRTFLPRLTYPLRVGTHFNTSFALTLAWDWAEGRDNGLRSLIAQSVITWFDRDIDCQAWEPGGDEFLSPALTEALVMSRVFDAPSFRNWFDAFLPRVGGGGACHPVHPCHRLRPQRRQDRASRRPQPQPRLVLADDRGQAGRGSSGGGAGGSGRRRPSGRQPAAYRRQLYGRALARHLRATGAGGMIGLWPLP